MRLKNKLVIGLCILFVGALFFLISMAFRRIYQDPQRFYEHLRALGGWGPILIVLVDILQVVLAPIPGQLLGIATGYLYGPVWGTLLSLGGLGLGSWLTMWLGRRFGRPLVERLADPQTIQRLDCLAQRYGLWFFFLVFLLPFLPTDVGCLVAGLTPLPIIPLVLLSIVGRLPGVLILNWVGATSRSFGLEVTVIVVILTLLVGAAIARYSNRIQELIFTWLERLG